MPKKSIPIPVTADDLPLCCPRPQDSLWNAHPKIYLPIEAEKEVTCPYCGTHYALMDVDD